MQMNLVSECQLSMPSINKTIQAALEDHYTEYGVCHLTSEDGSKLCTTYFNCDVKRLSCDLFQAVQDWYVNDHGKNSPCPASNWTDQAMEWSTSTEYWSDPALNSYISCSSCLGIMLISVGNFAYSALQVTDTFITLICAIKNCHYTHRYTCPSAVHIANPTQAACLLSGLSILCMRVYTLAWQKSVLYQLFYF